MLVSGRGHTEQQMRWFVAFEPGNIQQTSGSPPCPAHLTLQQNTRKNSIILSKLQHTPKTYLRPNKLRFSEGKTL